MILSPMLKGLSLAIYCTPLKMNETTKTYPEKVPSCLCLLRTIKFCVSSRWLKVRLQVQTKRKNTSEKSMLTEEPLSVAIQGTAFQL